MECPLVGKNVHAMEPPIYDVSGDVACKEEPSAGGKMAIAMYTYVTLPDSNCVRSPDDAATG